MSCSRRLTCRRLLDRARGGCAFSIAAHTANAAHTYPVVIAIVVRIARGSETMPKPCLLAV